MTYIAQVRFIVCSVPKSYVTVDYARDSTHPVPLRYVAAADIHSAAALDSPLPFYFGICELTAVQDVGYRIEAGNALLPRLRILLQKQGKNLDVIVSAANASRVAELHSATLTAIAAPGAPGQRKHIALDLSNAPREASHEHSLVTRACRLGPRNMNRRAYTMMRLDPRRAGAGDVGLREEDAEQQLQQQKYAYFVHTFTVSGARE